MGAYSVIKKICLSLIVGLAVLMPGFSSSSCPGCHSSGMSRVSFEERYAHCCQQNVNCSTKTYPGGRHLPCRDRQCINHCNLCWNTAEITHDIQGTLLDSSSLFCESALLVLSAPSFSIYKPPEISRFFITV